MSRLTAGISGVIALSAILCAAQFALEFALGRDFAFGRDLGHDLGRDLTRAAQDRRQIVQPPSFAAVNRGAKADRAASPAGSPALTRTVSLKFDGFSATSFLLRIPLADSNRSLAAPPAKSGARKPMLACEPVVSVLTEVVKHLQPGRCVT